MLKERFITLFFLINIVLGKDIIIDFLDNSRNTVNTKCNNHNLHNFLGNCYERKSLYLPKDGYITVEYSASDADELSVVIEDSERHIVFEKQFNLVQNNNNKVLKIFYNIEDANTKYNVSKLLFNYILNNRCEVIVMKYYKLK